MGTNSIKKLGAKCILLCFFTLANYAYADCNSAQCIETEKWRVGIALGAGAKTNPLVGGDAIPLVLIPDIAYYGDNVYLDNAEVGYQWIQTPTFALDTFFSVNTEKAFFTFWHPSNVLGASGHFLSNAIGPSNASPFDDRQVSVDEVKSRKWAIDAGIRWHKRSADSQWRIAVKTDASNVHHGHQFEISYQHHWSLNEWQVSLAPTVIWKSSKLVDYYYGVDQQDNVLRDLYYDASAGWQPSLALSANKKINQQWQWLIRTSVTWLHSGMTNSPLVDKKYTSTVFIGLGYVFK